MSEVRELEAEFLRLRRENEVLRAKLDELQRSEERLRKARIGLFRGGFRVLVPLLDRQRVVRSFGRLTETLSAFSGPNATWPAREQVLLDAREFLESVVRFIIRRRLFVLFFSLIATAIPLVQIWLVFQQNKIIENQTKFAEVQLFDVVARSITEGDRNARTIVGSLLANADPAFLKNVVEEAFASDAVALFRRDGIKASERRVQDAAFRGSLMRAVTRVVARRSAAGEPARVVWREVHPLLRRILGDSEYRLPEVLRTGRGEAPLSEEAAEEVDLYLAETGELLSVLGRLARSAGEERAFLDDLRPLVKRLSKMSSLEANAFVAAYRVLLQDFLLEVAARSKLGDGEPELGGREPAEVVSSGLARLREVYGKDGVDWEKLEAQAKEPGT